MKPHRLAVAALAMCLATIRGASGGEKVHSVSSGDSASSIAAKYYGDVALGDFLLLYNGRTGTVIHAGEKLKVPYCDVHRVGKGDTWSSLATKHLEKTQAHPVVAALNGFAAGAALPAGESIVIPVVLSYQLGRGEALASIAERFYGDPDRADLLQVFNDVGDPRRLSVGETVKVPLVSIRLRKSAAADLPQKKPAPVRVPQATAAQDPVKTAAAPKDSAPKPATVKAPDVRKDSASKPAAGKSADARKDPAPKSAPDKAMTVPKDPAPKTAPAKAVTIPKGSAPKTETVKAADVPKDPAPKTETVKAVDVPKDPAPKTETVKAADVPKDPAPKTETVKAADVPKDSAPKTETANAADVPKDPAPKPAADAPKDRPSEPAAKTPDPPKDVPQPEPTVSQSSRFDKQIRDAAQVYAEGDYLRARRQLESLRDRAQSGGTDKEKAEIARLLAYVYVAFDMHAEACAAFGAAAAFPVGTTLDPDLVSPKIRDTLSRCPGRKG